MASIKKRPNGTYQATIYIGRDADGKQLFKYVTKDGLKRVQGCCPRNRAGISRRKTN